MKKTMIATVLGLALMPLTFAAQTPAKPADNSTPSTSTDTTKAPVKKHKKTHATKKPAAKTPATNASPAATPAPAQK